MANKSKKKQFYAVMRPGFRPTICSWGVASALTQGVSVDYVKGFPTHDEAQTFLREKGCSFPTSINTTDPIPNSPIPATNRTNGSYYAVAKGRQPGVYTSYDQVQIQVKGFSGCVHKAFKTRSEAERFVREYEVTMDALNTRRETDDFHSLSAQLEGLNIAAET